MCVDNTPPLSNWGTANMIRPNLKDDQGLPPQRRFTVMHVRLCALLRGGPAQFDDSIKLLFQQKDMTAKHCFLFSLRPIPKMPHTKTNKWVVCQKVFFDLQPPR